MTSTLPLRGDDSVLSPQQIREIRRPLISKMVDGVANMGHFRLGDAEFAAAVRDWDEVLAPVPFEQLNRLRQIGLAAGKIRAPEFLEIWEASGGSHARLVAEAARLEKREAHYARETAPQGPGRRELLEYLAKRGITEAHIVAIGRGTSA